MDTSADRRRHTRIPLDGRMEGQATVLAPFRVVALSEVGASLEMAISLSIGSECDITVNLSHVSVDLKSRVASVRPPEAPEGPYTIGVEFHGVSTLDQAFLESFLGRERQRRT
jgi:hypothetical protein